MISKSKITIGILATIGIAYVIAVLLTGDLLFMREVEVIQPTGDKLIYKQCQYFQKDTLYSPINTQKVTWEVYDNINCTGIPLEINETEYGMQGQQKTTGYALVRIYENLALIECRVSADCGTGEPIDSLYCEESILYQDANVYSCIDNVCIPKEAKITIESCDYGCSNGACLPPTSAYCGNEICQTGETCSNCAVDCGTCLVPEGIPVEEEILVGTPLEMTRQTQNAVTIGGIFAAILFAILFAMRRKS